MIYLHAIDEETLGDVVAGTKRTYIIEGAPFDGGISSFLQLRDTPTAWENGKLLEVSGERIIFSTKTGITSVDAAKLANVPSNTNTALAERPTNSQVDQKVANRVSTNLDNLSRSTLMNKIVNGATGTKYLGTSGNFETFPAIPDALTPEQETKLNNLPTNTSSDITILKLQMADTAKSDMSNVTADSIGDILTAGAPENSVYASDKTWVKLTADGGIDVTDLAKKDLSNVTQAVLQSKLLLNAPVASVWSNTGWIDKDTIGLSGGDRSRLDNLPGDTNAALDAKADKDLTNVSFGTLTDKLANGTTGDKYQRPDGTWNHTTGIWVIEGGEGTPTAQDLPAGFTGLVVRV